MEIHLTNEKGVGEDAYFAGFSTRLKEEMNNTKWYFIEKIGNQFWNRGEATQAEIQRINEAHKVLHDYLFFVRKNLELKKNYEECHNTMERVWF